MKSVTTDALKKKGMKHMTLQKKDALSGYMFIAPALLSLLVFMVYPVIASFAISGFDWGILTPPRFIGLENYKTLFKDPVFLESLKNTFVWVIMYVPASILVSLIVALAMDMPLRGIGFFRTMFYLPVMTPMVVCALLFVWIYNTDFGALNYILSFFKIAPVRWLTDKNISLISIALMSVWKHSGYNMLILLSALQGIPESLYEAAALDGITPWRKLINIKLPLIMPSMYFVVLTSVIDAFQVFTEVYIMTKGGPGYSTYTVSFYLFNNAFEFGKMGYACAMSVVMFVIILTVTLIQDKIMNKNVQYDT
ncbi:sugar ABC transporter permease [Sedimentibacter sp.]|uniref:carbohydrate ABC transporter permease n=1 Tax=Sedimentibacter sp. TaxID=1960295 RepID=UPI002899DFA1|nr:sugar ABC transporter permease [Sedimentibacter sp.]